MLCGSLESTVGEIANGGANGSIIGRNSFQRDKKDALALLETIVKIYQGKA
jgi:class I fructose-bisphosphate aldolase